MKALRVALLRFFSFFKREQQEQELNNELETHLQLQIDDNLALGTTFDFAASARNNPSQ
jgi:hypothetical protein